MNLYNNTKKKKWMAFIIWIFCDFQDIKKKITLKKYWWISVLDNNVYINWYTFLFLLYKFNWSLDVSIFLINFQKNAILHSFRYIYIQIHRATTQLCNNTAPPPSHPYCTLNCISYQRWTKKRETRSSDARLLVTIDDEWW